MEFMKEEGINLTKVTLRRHSDPEIEGEKRFHAPYTVEFVCGNKECRIVHVKDLTEDYLSNPEIDAPYKLGLYCPECDWEGACLLWVNIVLTAMMPAPEGKPVDG